jgi:cholesterol transport system auxiliary component
MNPTLRLKLRAASAAVVLLCLGGCALLGGGGGKPATLYTLGSAEQNAAHAAPSGKPVVILYIGADFERQSAGNGILTSTGNEAAYIADARWVEPAEEMFDRSAIAELQRAIPAARIVRSGDLPSPDYALTIWVTRFEARLGDAPQPVASIDARVKLLRVADRAIIGDWPVTRREPAGANRVGEIVAALNRAMGEVTTEAANLARDGLASR